MSDTTYVDFVQPAISAEWLNEVNDHVWSDTPVLGATVHDASVIKNTPAGTVVATTVQNAINEISTDIADVAQDLVDYQVLLASSTGSSNIGHIATGVDAVATTVQDKLQETISVADFGAVGSGDETTKLQAALTAASGKTLILNPNIEYTISTTLTVPTGTTIIGYGATLKNTTTHITLLSLASGCNVYGLTLVGAGGAYDAAGRAIYATGVRNGVGVAPTYISDITIRDCVLSNFGAYGVEFDYVARSFITNNTIKTVGYSGILCYSCDSVLVEGNYIDTLAGETVSGELNAYGITFTSLVNTSDFVRDPQSQYCRAIGNLVRNIPTWHGLDTHGGTHCDFLNNRIENCRRGIILTNLTTIGASHCTIRGNVLINLLIGTNSNGSQKQGEAFWDIGASSSIRNSYNSITNNTTFQHGSPTELLPCVYINNAEDGTVQGNTLTEPYTAGIGVFSNVRRYVITNNNIINPKGAGVGGGGSTDFPSGVLFSGTDFTTITLMGNTINRNNTSVATKVGELGVIVANTASKSITAHKNVFVGVVADWFIPEATGMSGEFSGSFTGSLTGCTTVPTGTIRYTVSDRHVTLSIDSSISGTSNATTLTVTGMPLFIAPTDNRYIITRVTDNGIAAFGICIVSSTGVLSYFKDATLQALTNTGTKGTPQQTLSYLI